MNRRTFLQATGVSAAVAPSLAFAQDSDEGLGRELVVHTVVHHLRETSPLLIYSGLERTLEKDPLLVEAAGRSPAVEVWNDWNDHDLHKVFGAFTVGTPDVMLGSYRIFDTPDIAYAVHQPVIEELEQGYIPVGGTRASRLVVDDFTIASLRLWNVIIDGVLDENESSDVMMGLVKHLGRAIGAID